MDNDRRFDMDKESSILWALHTQFGFGPKRLKKAWEMFYTVGFAYPIWLWPQTVEKGLGTVLHRNGQATGILPNGAGRCRLAGPS